MDESCPSQSDIDSCGPSLEAPSETISDEEADVEPLRKKWKPSVTPPLFPEDMDVEDISENVKIDLQTSLEDRRLGGGYCVMWMLWLSLMVSKNEVIWKKETTFFQRQEEYKKIYQRGQGFYTPNPAQMADVVIQTIAKDEGRRTTRCRILKDSTGKVRNTKGNPYEDLKATNEKFMKPVRTIIQKRAGDKFSIAANSHLGFDLFVQSTDPNYVNLCTTQLQDLVKKAERPILISLCIQPKLGAKFSHAVAAIYYPKEYCLDTKTPEFHILSTYASDDIERDNIIAMIPHVIQPTATAGRRKTQRRNMRKKRKQTSKRMR